MIIAGGGVFGVTAAISLARRGREVTLIDPGQLPSPLAASTDISKVVRREYGTDTYYMELGERSIQQFKAWNEDWPEPLYHEVGLLLLSRGGMKPDSFEYESYQTLRQAGFDPERFNKESLKARAPAWNAEAFPDGFFHAPSGYAQSEKVLSQLLSIGESLGVEFREEEGLAGLLERDGRVFGLRTTKENEIQADQTLVAAGAWTGHLLGLTWGLWASGHPVFHLRPENPDLFRPECFPVFTADIAETGWYGFPINDDGVVKVARHALGRKIHPDEERVVTQDDHKELQKFLSFALPDLVTAEIVYTRLCLYSDTANGHFWIDEDPDRKGLFVAAGGSGHGFKFAPMLGDIIADVLDHKDFRERGRFAWRAGAAEFNNEEESRATHSK